MSRTLHELGGTYYSLPLPVGSKIKFLSEKQRYTVMASNVMFAVCTKPMNAKKTVLYTVVDFHERVRGCENLVFGMGAETKDECEEMLERLTSGESEVSSRNFVPLDIESVEIKSTSRKPYRLDKPEKSL